MESNGIIVELIILIQLLLFFILEILYNFQVELNILKKFLGKAVFAFGASCFSEFLTWIAVVAHILLRNSVCF